MSDTQPVRSVTNRRLLGVCGGIAERYGIDPLVVRIAVVVLAVFGGLGVVLYLIGAALLPEPGDTTDLLSGRRLGWVLLAGLAALIVVPNYVFGFGADSFAINLALVVALGAVVVLMVRRPAAVAVPAEPDAPAPAAALTYGGIDQQAEYGGAGPQLAYGDLPYPPPAPPRPPRQRSYLGAFALSASVVWFGLAWLANAADISSLSAVTIFGVSLAILGAGILVGAWIGRARWLVLFALPLALVVWGLSAVPDAVRLDQAPDWLSEGIGDERVPVGEQDFALGVGTATLDLAQWTGAGIEEVQASVGVGELLVVIPEGWDVVVDAEVGYGTITRDTETLADGPGIAERMTFDSPAPDAPRITIDARVDVGQIRAITSSGQVPPTGAEPAAPPVLDVVPGSPGTVVQEPVTDPTQGAEQ